MAIIKRSDLKKQFLVTATLDSKKTIFSKTIILQNIFERPSKNKAVQQSVFKYNIFMFFILCFKQLSVKLLGVQA